MEYFGYLSSICFLFGLIQLLSGASVEDKYEPMVAFICDRPAMHRGVNGWVADKTQDCPDTLEEVLDYCKKVYPDHHVTNVVESSRFYDIENWPMGTADRKHTHHVRPFRCLVGGFQSDALLVPQHCEFDHKHDITKCKEFSHWNQVADKACTDKKWHLESFGMLLYCGKVGHFNGVEYVCCPNPTETRAQPVPVEDDKPDSAEWSSSEEDDDSDETSDEDDDDEEYDTSSEESSEDVDSSSSSQEDSSVESSEESDVSDESPDNSLPWGDQIPNENVADLYEAYLRGQPFPGQYDNEHKKYLAAKERMRLNQKKKVAKLLQEWEKAREHVNEVRKTDPKTANKMNEEIAMRFKHLYASFKQEDEAEMQQLIALHQQHIQSILNERKRDAMDKYMQALESGEIPKVTRYLQRYVKAEEKDRMHTVNHYEHIKYSNPKEALRIHRHIINHLKLSEMRIDQALEMLTHYPDIEAAVRPEIEEFMKNFNAIATSIKEVVLPVPELEEDSGQDTSDVSDSSDSSVTSDIDIDSSQDSSTEEKYDSSSEEVVSDVIDDEVQENEHIIPDQDQFHAHAMDGTHNVDHNGLQSEGGAAAHGSQIGSTVGIALGSVSVFVVIVVAAMMIRRNQSKQSVAHGYVEVDPSATPEERHLANMQMNGYENPTYKYFEVANNPKA